MRLPAKLGRIARSRDVVGPSPYEVLLRHELMELRRYVAPDTCEHSVPVLLVPPLMARSFIFDLHAERSLVRFLVEEGFAVYVIDWAAPTRRDRGVKIDDYVARWLPLAVDRISEDVDGGEVSLVGYCLGGLFCLWYLGSHPRAPVRNLALVASPVDMRRMGSLIDLARAAWLPAATVGRALGNIPGPLSSAVFRLTSPMGQLTQLWELALADEEDDGFMEAFAAMHWWMADFAALPGSTYDQLLRTLIRDNRAYQGRLRVDGRRVDLRRITQPVWAVAGASDMIVGTPAVHAIAHAVASRDVTTEVAPGGHAGVLAGRHAREKTWAPLASWLADRSGANG